MKNDSFKKLTPYIQWVGGNTSAYVINFNLYPLLIEDNNIVYYNILKIK